MRVLLSLFFAVGPLILPVFGAEFPQFKMQEIATDLSVGYAVIAADINGDKKPDLVVVDTKRVVWYENPTWKMHTIITGKTKPDNVCVAALDIDGDGQLDLVLGADWKPFNTKEGGTLQWLKRGKTLDEEWSIHPIAEEPTVHRVRVADIDGDGKPEIILAPLMGRDSTKEKNWVDGRPVRILAFPIPKDPVAGPWKPIVLSESLNVVHNIWPVTTSEGKKRIYAVSYDGVHLISQRDNAWQTTKFGLGNQDTPNGSRGASEIKLGQLSPRPFVATVEPWHGNQVVTYTPPQFIEEPIRGKTPPWDRHVIDDHLRWGHGVWCADLDGDGADELIIGVRDNPAKGDKFTEKCGVRIYKATDKIGAKWDRLMLDDGGIATEDLIVTDLDGDGKPDIVAVGRATHNARIYWNQGKK
ncbi:FG-GAP repeat domain-containing protein [Zavarzinella formosa]|uniref:FG-GAP repeat domain-containing protein n=1 Tax=Zavarzinella formosa TaxID=360055 RepID=UPI00031B5A1F|nr:VCBS repeat-containing protein [Zavarzinella formosa]